MDLFTLALIKNKQGSGSGGIDTSDATATIDDLVEGTTAYVNGEKIEGTLTNSNNEYRIPDGLDWDAGIEYRNVQDMDYIPIVKHWLGTSGKMMRLPKDKLPPDFDFNKPYFIRFFDNVNNGASQRLEVYLGNDNTYFDIFFRAEDNTCTVTAKENETGEDGLKAAYFIEKEYIEFYDISQDDWALLTVFDGVINEENGYVATNARLMDGEWELKAESKHLGAVADIYITDSLSAMHAAIKRGSCLSHTIDFQKLTEAMNITSDQIAKGSTVLGIKGTAEVKDLNFDLLSTDNFTVTFSDNPIEYVTAINNVNNSVTDTFYSSMKARYQGVVDSAPNIGNDSWEITNVIVKHKNTNGIMTYYGYFSDETLPFATALADTSAYTIPGYYIVDYNTKSIKERVGSSLTLHFTYSLTEGGRNISYADGYTDSVGEENEQQWKNGFYDLIKDIQPYEPTIEVQELQKRIAELEAEATEANAIIDQLNGEEV